MALQINEVTSSIVKIVKELIGYRLSLSPAQSGTTPSVILNRSGANKADFPYAVVDHIGVNKQGYSDIAHYLDDNGDEVNEFEYIGRFSVSIHGGINDDVISICQELQARLFTTKGNNLIDEYLSPLSSLMTVTNPTFFPTRLSTDFEEVSRINIDLSMRDVIVDQTNDVIEIISTDGELYDDYDQETPPLTITANAP